MDSEVESVEERLKSFLGQLHAEYGILDRLIYKNKNQHRRCSYFQYLLKVRRDLRLLDSLHLEEIVGSCFHIITGNKPKQKVYLLESLKRRKCDSGKHTFMDRLLGASRLLSQMVEPMLKAATEISTLLARSFFMGFSVTILSLLARFRVLVQQILVDVVLVFNMVSSISQKAQSIKIIQEGIEVFREYYPTNEQVVTLECVWEKDKFVLLEKRHKSEINNHEGGVGQDVPPVSSAIRYQSIDAFLGGDELGSAKVDTETIINPEEGSSCHMEDTPDVIPGTHPIESDGDKVVESQNFEPEGGALHESSKLCPASSTLNYKAASKSKVAFVSVKRPAPPPTVNETEFHSKKMKTGEGGEKEDPFFSLLTAGNLRDCLFPSLNN